jgi:hypothetical protein
MGRNSTAISTHRLYYSKWRTIGYFSAAYITMANYDGNVWKRQKHQLTIIDVFIIAVKSFIV